ncbi:MAG: hypothetical protein ACYS0C_00580 [Planctomycetota bacterium]|jgi:hypothetical protein
MSERISSKVVQTAALAKSSDVLRSANRSKNHHHKVGDVVSVDVRVRRPGNSVRDEGLFWDVLENGNPAFESLTYTRRLEVARVCKEDGLSGQILDCYV